ncbi:MULTISPECIES: sensor histidine kinase [Limnospira]|jgi:signal transduction histidine kinase|uniref:histidine kinase n=1 Tax=Limnospira platensis NIES-46 TaxID=1236695 RepID=A0A5M3T8E4_LIMPL|nr:HAMP domain-containing sensor histidine kinase [Arthrospira platensis]MDT9182743.1 HAMP domain-containing sensor histidine kinase [Limnospira sp. PMC 289.06]GCE94076.1 two-component sensor histidine kinase [Arthrospira platensis NIES-46]
MDACIEDCTPPSASVFSHTHLRLESTLQELSLYDFQVDLDQAGMVLAKMFETNPTLPGVILNHDCQFIGMISRRRFLEYLSRPYGRELFLPRSIRALYKFSQVDLLILPGNTLIVDAARLAIMRSPEQIYEPIIVQISDSDYRLLDTQQLLIVHSYIHQLATELLQAQTQAQLRQTEKLASLGKMVAGVAHEIRNPVGCIVGNTHCLTQYYEDIMQLINAYEQELITPRSTIEQLKEDIDWEFLKTDGLEMLKSIQVSAEQLNHLVNSLRTFSHMDNRQRREMDIHECLDSTLIILKNRLKVGIEVIKNYGNLPKFSGYSGLLSQVFMNLLANAIDALEETANHHPNAAKIWISTHVADSCPSQLRSLIIPPPNYLEYSQNTQASEAAPTPQTQYIVIRITDNGPGIPKEIQNRIFDNFFTTKSAEKGTGLGLAISHEIIYEKHSGCLHLLSTNGVGTEFEIVLPLI